MLDEEELLLELDDEVELPIVAVATMVDAESIGEFLAKYSSAVVSSVVFLFLLLLSSSFLAFNLVIRPSTAETVAVTFAPAFDLITLSPKYLISSSTKAVIVTLVISRLVHFSLLCQLVHSSPIWSFLGCLEVRNAICSTVA